MLTEAARILKAEVHGLDTTSREDFRACARALAPTCDVMVVAGGDGSLSDVLNTIDTRERPVAYLPLGSGNAMGHALRLRGRIAEVAARIREGRVREVDLIECDERRLAYMVSIGLEGAVIQRRNEYKARGASGLKAYLMALVEACLKDVRGAKAGVAVNGCPYETNSLLSVMIMKEPYYGYGVKVMPGARLDDRRLHVRVLDSRCATFLLGGATALTIGNRAGFYQTGQRVSVALERPLLMQADGEVAWEAKEFRFKILPGALRIIS